MKYTRRDLQDLSAQEKRAALAQMLQTTSHKIFPLSCEQKGFWITEQLFPHSSFYNMPFAVKLDGTLDVEVLKRSLNEIIRRHEALRTKIIVHKDSHLPGQFILPRLILDIPIIYLDKSSPDTSGLTIEQLMRDEAQRPFDLTAGPLLRATLLRLEKTRHILLFTFHHIIADDWSLSIFFRELSTLYDAYLRGAPSPLADPVMQYSDYTLWQREWLQKERLETLLTYWRRQLDGMPTLLELPIARSRSMVQSSRGTCYEFLLPLSLMKNLQSLSQREGVTLFMTMLAAFLTLLYRYTGQEDLAIGSPIAGRNRLETEGLIGLFVNTLVLRTNVSHNPTFRELLQRVRETTLEAYAHQDLPFGELVQDLQPPRMRHIHPLVQILFVFQNAPMEEVNLPYLSFSAHEVENGSAKFDLLLELREIKAGLQGRIEYNMDLFDAPSIARMVGHFHTILQEIVAHADDPVAALPLLTEDEYTQMLITWNSPTETSSSPQEECIHHLFEAQAMRTPDRPALICNNEQLTYRQLNERANQLAHYLRKSGVGPEVGVGICLPRCLDLIVGLLGILKAGGVYVPLDPTYPQERLGFILQDSQIGVCLTKSDVPAAARQKISQQNAQIVDLDEFHNISEHQSSTNPQSDVESRHLAYIIYTSGSTGKPKGVAIEHRSAVAFLDWSRKIFTPEEFDGMLASTSVCFDLSIFEIFAPLSWGGKVILVENVLSLSRLPDVSQVKTINTVPSAMKALLGSGPLPSSVRCVNLAGEALPAALVQDVYQYKHVQRVFNLYGPSEDTTYSTYALLSRESTQTPPIGRPVANTQTYILDTRMLPVPIGVPGELYLGGAGLARGYLNRPELTANKFVNFTLRDGARVRVYKTGDLARYRPDGNIEFLGRLDHQVKIRGFRIELGEIEEHLLLHPLIQDAAVWTYEDTSGDIQLIAYIVLKKDQLAGESIFQGYLRKYLPRYMLPTVFVFLEHLPLNGNGKVDYRALPAPSQQRSTSSEAFVHPRNTLEEDVTRVFESVLNVRPVGITDNFFDLGGHSLLAIRLMAQIQKEFQQDLPPSLLFENATVEQIATILQQKNHFEKKTPLVKIQPNGLHAPFICVHPIGGDVFWYTALARHLGPNQPFYALEDPDIYKNDDGCFTVEEVASRYSEAIWKHQPRGPVILGGWSFGGAIGYEIACQLESKGFEVPLLVLFDTYAPVAAHEIDASDALLVAWIADSIVKSMVVNDPGKAPYPTKISEELCQMTLDEQISYLRDLAEKVQFELPEKKEEYLLSRIYKYRTHIKTANSYLPTKKFARRVVFLRAEIGRDGTPCDPNVALQWNNLVSHPIEIYSFPARHGELIQEPFVRVVAERLGNILNDLPGKGQIIL